VAVVEPRADRGAQLVDFHDIQIRVGVDVTQFEAPASSGAEQRDWTIQAIVGDHDG
jgi:hypothetical protein